MRLLALVMVLCAVSASQRQRNHIFDKRAALFRHGFAVEPKEEIIEDPEAVNDAVVTIGELFKMLYKAQNGEKKPLDLNVLNWVVVSHTGKGPYQTTLKKVVGKLRADLSRARFSIDELAERLLTAPLHPDEPLPTLLTQCDLSRVLDLFANSDDGFYTDLANKVYTLLRDAVENSSDEETRVIDSNERERKRKKQTRINTPSAAIRKLKIDFADYLEWLNPDSSTVTEHTKTILACPGPPLEELVWVDPNENKEGQTEDFNNRIPWECPPTHNKVIDICDSSSSENPGQDKSETRGCQSVVQSCSFSIEGDGSASCEIEWVKGGKFTTEKVWVKFDTNEREHYMNPSNAMKFHVCQLKGSEETRSDETKGGDSDSLFNAPIKCSSLNSGKEIFQDTNVCDVSQPCKYTVTDCEKKTDTSLKCFLEGQEVHVATKRKHLTQVIDESQTKEGATACGNFFHVKMMVPHLRAATDLRSSGSKKRRVHFEKGAATGP